MNVNQFIYELEYACFRRGVAGSGKSTKPCRTTATKVITVSTVFKNNQWLAEFVLKDEYGQLFNVYLPVDATEGVNDETYHF